MDNVKKPIVLTSSNFSLFDLVHTSFMYMNRSDHFSRISSVNENQNDPSEMFPSQIVGEVVLSTCH